MSASKYKDALIAQLDQAEAVESLNDGETRLYHLEDEGELVGAILYTETDGSLTADFFEDADELAEAWDELGEEDEDEEDADEDED